MIGTAALCRTLADLTMGGNDAGVSFFLRGFFGTLIHRDHRGHACGLPSPSATGVPKTCDRTFLEEIPNPCEAMTSDEKKSS